MMKLWAVFQKELKVFIKDKGAILQFFLVPIVVISVANFAMERMYGGSISIKLPVVDNDQSESSRRLIAEIKDIEILKVENDYKKDGATYAMTERYVRNLINNNERSVALIIPQGFGENIHVGRKVRLDLLENPIEQMSVAIIREVMKVVASRLSANSIAMKLAAEVLSEKNICVTRDYLIGQTIGKSQKLWKDPPIAINHESLISLIGNKMDPMKQNVPGFAIMFALFSLAWGSMSLITERQQGTFERILCAPISKAEILGGKLMTTFAIACFQLFVFFAFGHFVFGMDLGNSIAGVILMSIAVALTATSMGIFIASIVRTPAQAGGLTSLIIIGMSALGGSWWPSEFMPEYIRVLGHFATINAWAMDGYKDLLWYGRGVIEILPEIGVLVGLAIFVFSIGVWRFRFE